MKHLSIALFFIALVIGVSSQASALQTNYANKMISLNFVVTPSPTPIGYSPGATQAVAVAAERASKSLASNGLLWPSNPLDRLLAFAPIKTSDLVAQTQPQGNVNVQFTVKADPKYANFHIIPHIPGGGFAAGYGSNTYTCAYEIFAQYTTAWKVVDWVYGSNTSGGTPGLNGYPTNNYPTQSQLSWLAETVTSTFAPFANSGSPGETAFSGLANTSKQICFDLTLNVPPSVSAGTYQTTIQYTMAVTF